MAGPETFNPAVLKPSMKTSGGDLKPSLVTSSYSSGTPGAGDLKPSLLKADGDLKESLLDGSSLKASLTGGFNPSQVADLVAWFDPTDNSSLTISSGVSAFVDKAGVHTLSQSNSSLRPTLSTINSKQAINFSGTTYIFTSSAGLADLPSSSTVQPLTVFCVLQPDAVSQVYPFTWGNSVWLNPFLSGIHFDAANLWRTAYRNNAQTPVFVNSVTTYDSATAYVVTTTISATIVGRVNGSQVISTANTASGNITTDLFSMGCLLRSTAVAFFDGQVGDLLIYDRVLGASEIASVEGFLSSKWSI